MRRAIEVLTAAATMAAMPMASAMPTFARSPDPDWITSGGDEGIGFGLSLYGHQYTGGVQLGRRDDPIGQEAQAQGLSMAVEGIEAGFGVVSELEPYLPDVPDASG